MNLKQNEDIKKEKTFLIILCMQGYVKNKIIRIEETSDKESIFRKSKQGNNWKIYTSSIPFFFFKTSGIFMTISK